MSRTAPAALNQGIEARPFTVADTLVADLSSWRGAQSSPMGGHIRFGPFRLPNAGAGNVKVVLDESMSWQDRVLTVIGRLSQGGAGDIRPGAAGAVNIRQQSLGSASRVIHDCFYTANGWDGNPATARGGAGMLNYCEFLNESTALVEGFYRLYSDSTNGHRLTLWSNDGTGDVHGYLWLFATEQTGKLVSVP